MRRLRHVSELIEREAEVSTVRRAVSVPRALALLSLLFSAPYFLDPPSLQFEAYILPIRCFSALYIKH